MILRVEHISKSFNDLDVLADVSFTLVPGTITSLFGENGSGKTTLFHILAGFLKQSDGRVYFRDEDLYDKPAVEIDALGIGRIWQTPRIFKNITVQDNLLLAARNHPGERLRNYILRPSSIWEWEKALKIKSLEIAEQIQLAVQHQKTAGALSFGQQKLLSIGMLLMNDADLLLLDEPFSGVNENMIDALSSVFIALTKSGKTILLIEHNRAKATMISDKVLHLLKGRIAEDSRLAK